MIKVLSSRLSESRAPLNGRSTHSHTHTTAHTHSPDTCQLHCSAYSASPCAHAHTHTDTHQGTYSLVWKGTHLVQGRPCAQPRSDHRAASEHIVATPPRRRRAA